MNDSTRILEDQRLARARILTWVLGANFALMVAEIVGGIVFGSLALLADATHMVSDVTGLALALTAQRLLSRAPSPRHSYGLQRADVLAAQATGIILLASAGWIVAEAGSRLSDPPEVAAGGMLTVALLGLAVNVGSLALLARSREQSLSMRAAFMHMGTDAAGSVGVLIAAAASLAGVRWADPAVSLLLAALLVWSGARILLAATHILMEGTPRDLDGEDITAAIVAVEGVESTHHLHIWHLASDTIALSAHVVAAGTSTLEQAQSIAEEIRQMLDRRFSISHTTLEMEDHLCTDAPVRRDPGRETPV